jgi:hypothetical protein
VRGWRGVAESELWWHQSTKTVSCASLSNECRVPCFPEARSRTVCGGTWRKYKQCQSCWRSTYIVSYDSTPEAIENTFQGVTYGGLDTGPFGWIFGDFPLPSACHPQALCICHQRVQWCLASCHQRVHKFELRCGYNSAGDNEGDKSLCHSVKIISSISQWKTSIPLRRSLLSVTGWYAWSSCKSCSRKYVVLEDARNVVMHELVVTNSNHWKVPTMVRSAVMIGPTWRHFCWRLHGHVQNKWMFAVSAPSHASIAC